MFTNHMLAGTTIVPEGQPFVLSELEQGIRYMAIVPRYKRRIFGEAILEALEKGKTANRFTRAMLPGPAEQDHETGFFFMILAVPAFELGGGYEQYRIVRRKFLEIYAFALLEKYRYLKRIVGIATEPPGPGSSEDMIVAEPGEWTSEFVEQLRKAKKELNIVQEGNFEERNWQGNEFPSVPPIPAPVKSSPKAGLTRQNRKQRRAAVAKARRGK